MAKRTSRSSSKRASQLEQANQPASSSRSARSSSLNQAMPPQERAARSFAEDAQTEAERFGVEKDLIKALDELEAELGLADRETGEEAPRSFAFQQEGQMDLRNILGYGVGLKVSAGVLTATPCVKVYVGQKAAPDEIDEGRVPPEVGGYPTDVEVMPPIVAYNGRAKGGSACTVAGSHSYGTIGCLCVRDNKPLILSNNHVLANENSAPVGANVFTSPNRQWIGNLEEFVPLNPRQANAVDAALAWTNTESAVSPRHRNYSMNPNPTEARLGQTVKKDGARTGFTIGVVKDRIRSVSVSFNKLGTIHFHDVIVIQSLFGSFFSQPGDSGSIISTYDGNQPAGLLFAGGGSQTFANPIQTVMRILRIDRFLGGDE